MEYILRARKYNKVYIPYYTCDVVLEPFRKLGVSYAYYSINLDFEIADNIRLNDGTAILYTNYYGLKQQYIEQLTAKYGQQLIVDNTQAFYAKPIEGNDTFYTCRKFFGVPDGAYLYTDAVIEEELEQDVSFERMTFLTKRLDLGAEAGYADFRKQRKLLVGQPIKKMSCLTERMMQGIDYKTVARQRRENFLQLHEALKGTNILCNSHLKPWLTDKMSHCSDITWKVMVYRCVSPKRRSGWRMPGADIFSPITILLSSAVVEASTSPLMRKSIARHLSPSLATTSPL